MADSLHKILFWLKRENEKKKERETFIFLLFILFIYLFIYFLFFYFFTIAFRRSSMAIHEISRSNFYILALFLFLRHCI